MDIDMGLAIIAGLAVLLGLAGTVLPLLPGAPLLFGGLWLAGSLDDYSRVGIPMLMALAFGIAWFV
ncbi:MAG: hypothetical protein RLY71_3493 [Pseudomonadota bacterium]|jgi:hypothetical protein